MDRRRGIGVLVTALVVTAIGLPGIGQSASSSAVVTATVPSATNLSLAGCPASARSFGTVLPGSSSTTASSCSITFGSSNDTARMRLRQLDGAGAGMFRYADATLDAAWGASGSTIAAAGPGDDFSSAMAVAPDGSVYVGGYSDDAGTWRMRVVRLSATGAIDASFGSGGVLTTSVVGPPQRYNLGMALQPDGRLLVAGPVVGSGGYDFGVQRFSAAGVPDPGFGAGGLAQVDITPSQDWASDVLVRPDGRIVVTGMTNGGASAVWDYAAAGLTAAGALDPRFGTGGITISNSGGAVWDFSFAADLAPDGGILMAGTSNRTTYDPSMLRLDPAGVVDTSFGSAGWVVSPMPTGLSYGQAFDARVLADGGTLGCGSIYDGAKYVAMVLRHDATGTPVPTFGTAGWKSWPDSAGAVYGCVELADGRLQGVGDRMSPARAAVFRIEADGSPDPTLGSAGVQQPVIGSGFSRLTAVTVTRDGSLVAGGSATGSLRDFAAARFAGTTVPDHAAGGSDWNDGSGMFGVCLESVTTATTSAPWVAVGTAGCGPADSAGWRPIAAGATDPGTQVATTASGVVNATTSMRFGFRPPLSQAPGRYVAPLLVDVVAP